MGLPWAAPAGYLLLRLHCTNWLFPQSPGVSATAVVLYHRSVFTQGPTDKSNIPELVGGFSSLHEYSIRTDGEFWKASEQRWRAGGGTSKYEYGNVGNVYVLVSWPIGCSFLHRWSGWIKANICGLSGWRQPTDAQKLTFFTHSTLVLEERNVITQINFLVENY